VRKQAQTARALFLKSAHKRTKTLARKGLNALAVRRIYPIVVDEGLQIGDFI
jgi:hypothetical protein